MNGENESGNQVRQVISTIMPEILMESAEHRVFFHKQSNSVATAGAILFKHI